MASAYSNIHRLRPNLRLVFSNEVPRISGVARFTGLERVADCERNDPCGGSTALVTV
jgi:hypothetical protein